MSIPLVNLKMIKKRRVAVGKRPIVYFLFQGDEIVYIGSSINGIIRITNHYKTKLFDSFSTLECDADDCRALEFKYILKYQPKFNINAIMPNSKSILELFKPVELQKKPKNYRNKL